MSRRLALLETCQMCQADEESSDDEGSQLIAQRLSEFEGYDLPAEELKEMYNLSVSREVAATIRSFPDTACIQLQQLSFPLTLELSFARW